jgi:hypothetical protein
MAGKIDVIYPLGDGTAWGNNELRYSLRSLANVPNIGDVYVVGIDPGFLSNNVRFIEHKDRPGYNKDGNIIQKTLLALSASDNASFLRLSDDHIIMRETDDWPVYYRREELPKSWAYSNRWGMRAFAARKKLEERGLPVYDYETHSPMLMEKDKFIEIMSSFDIWEERGVVVNSLYYNSLDIPRESEPNFQVCRLRSPNIPNIIDQFRFLNYNDYALSERLKRFIMEKFPKKSIYEK